MEPSQGLCVLRAKISVYDRCKKERSKFQGNEVKQDGSEPFDLKTSPIFLIPGWNVVKALRNAVTF